MALFIDGTAAEMTSGMYLGLLGRSGDPSGYNYWKDKIENGSPVTECLNATVASDEYQDAVSGLSRLEAVDRLYQNLFNRSIDQGGIDFYVNGAASNVPIDEIIIDVANGATGDDSAAIGNRVASVDYFSNNLVTKQYAPILSYQAFLDYEQSVLSQIGPFTDMNSVYSTWDDFADSYYVFYGGLNN